MPKTPATPATEAPPENYEAAVSELENLVSRMESGQMPLADLLSGYRRGAQLLSYCRNQLDTLAQQIQVLEGETLKDWKADE